MQKCRTCKSKYNEKKTGGLQPKWKVSDGHAFGILFFSAHFIKFVYGPATQMDWMIWNTAEPMTTKTNSAWKQKKWHILQFHMWSVDVDPSVINMKILTISSGLTGYLSSVLEVFCTFPLFVTFLAFFSLAFLIWGVLGILRLCAGGGWCWRCSKCGETGAYVAVLDLLLDWDGWYQNCQHNTTCAQTAPIYIVSGTCHSLLANIK